MNTLESFLLTISNLLFYPVIVLIIIITIQQCISIGQLFREFKDRKKGTFAYIARFRQRLENMRQNKSDFNGHFETGLTTLLREWELEYIRSMRLNKFIIKAGPALGLMGTLIPMGTALASLSQGDMMAMSVNMVTAFTTTVVGMACGLSAYFIIHTRMHWKQSDLFTCETMCEKTLSAQQTNPEIKTFQETNT